MLDLKEIEIIYNNFEVGLIIKFEILGIDIKLTDIALFPSEDKPLFNDVNKTKLNFLEIGPE